MQELNENLEIKNETGIFIKVGCIKTNEKAKKKKIRCQDGKTEMNFVWCFITWICVEDSLSLSRQCSPSSKRMEYDGEKEGKMNIDYKLITSLIKTFMVVTI